MRTIIAIVVLSFSANLACAQIKKDTLTNGKVINMGKNGITDLLIKKSISAALYCDFDLSSDGIILLKRNKISDSIIVAMFDKVSSVNNSSSISAIITTNLSKEFGSESSNMSLDKLSPGIYYESDNKNNIEYFRLNATSPAQGMRTEPIIGVSISAEYTFHGKNALTQIKKSFAEFYLVMGKGYDDIIYQPTQFIVIRATEKKGNRIVKGKAGIGYGALRNLPQFDPKYIINPIYTRINDTLYKITFEKQLLLGNYFFGPTNGSAGTNWGSGKFYLEFDIIKSR